MTPQELKNSILQLAIQGKLVEQRPEEGTGEELYKQIQSEKARLIKEGRIKKEKPLPPISEDEMPFEIPDNWKWVRLNSVISLLSGSDLTPDKYNGQKNGIPYITGASNINNNTLIINRWTEYPNNIAHKGDLLLSCKGTVGKMTVLQEDAVHIARQIMAITSFCDTTFLQNFLETQINNLQKKAKSMIPGIERNNVLSLCIPLPSLSEQKRIVAKIEELLPLVEQYEKVYNRLEQLNKQFPDDMKKSILQLAIQGKLVEQRSEEGTGEELYKQIQTEKAKLIKEGKIKKEKLLLPISDDEISFDIPDSWKLVSINECGYFISGYTPKPEELCASGSIPYFKVADMNTTGNAKYLTNTKSFLKDNQARRFSAGSIVYPKNGGAVFTNKKRILQQDSVIDLNTGGYSLYLPTCIDYFFLFFSNIDFKHFAKGTALPTLDMDKVRSLFIPLPPLEEQKRIVAKIEELLPLCDLLNRKWA